MARWKDLFDALNTAIDAVAGLEPAPAPFILAMPDTLMVAGTKQAFVVEMPTSVDAGERQRTLSRDAHAVLVKVASRIEQGDGWRDTMGEILDVEFEVRTACLTQSSFPGVAIRWNNTSRSLTADRTYILSTLNFTYSQEAGV